MLPPGAARAVRARADREVKESGAQLAFSLVDGVEDEHPEELRASEADAVKPSAGPQARSKQLTE